MSSTPTQKILLNNYDDEEKWLAARRGGVGSSEISRLVFTGPHRVWHEKVFGYEERDGTTGGDSLAQMGRDLEPVNASIFTRETGIDCIDPGDYALAWDDELPSLLSMCATVDRFAYSEADRAVSGSKRFIAIDERGTWQPVNAVVELKAAFGEVARLCERLTTNDLRHSKLERYYWQIQHQLAVTDCKVGYLSILYFSGFAAGHRWFRCERDERVIAAIRKRVREFWDCVDTKTAPDWKLATAADISAMTARPPTGDTVEIDGEHDVNAFVELEEITRRRAAVNAEHTDAKAKWIARGNGATRIVCGDRQIQLRNDKGKPFFKLKNFKEDYE